MELPKTRDGFVVREDAGDFFLIDTDGGEVFQINQTAARIFAFCQKGGTFEALVSALAEELSEPGQDAAIRADVDATVRQMVELGICEA